ncbi:MAG: carbohydrate ABC transporter substrate-binding protein [Rhodobacteraceae bacterium]|nr:carbohydrate ABC transporter substrate-binding protein [Paracoccaceae bacterium]
MNYRSILAALAATVALPVNATDLEVTHWWTSGGEAAAVAVFASAFDASGNTWVDGAIAGGSGSAVPVIVSRIIGGDPMGATMMNTGRDADELIEAGLMLDLTELAEAEGWADVINPPSLFENCIRDGHVYCVPVNIHSWQWIWLNNGVYTDNGMEVPSNWAEFVAAAPALRDAGIVPLAMGQKNWHVNGAFGVISVALGGLDWFDSVNVDRDAEVVNSDLSKSIWQAFADARELSVGSNVTAWNEATNLVITGKAGGQIMGDWAQGEFAAAGQVAGVDYTCLPGLGANEVISTGGDSFYFPKNDDPEVEAAQLVLASLLISKEVQVAFNLAKGSLPVRGDVDLSAANDCMKKGLEILAAGNILPDGNQLWTPGDQAAFDELAVEFWNDPSISAEEGHARWASIIENAEE